MIAWREPPAYPWPGDVHEASELEEILSSYPKVARLLRLSTDAFLDFPGF